MQVSAPVVDQRVDVATVVLQRQELRVEAVTSPAGLAERARPWGCLIERCGHRVPSLSYAWVASHLEHLLAPGETWCCFFAWEGDVLRGVLPIVAAPVRLGGRSGLTLATPHGLHTMSVDLACESEAAERVVPPLILAMERHFPTWVEARLPRLSALSPTLRSVATPELEVLAATELAEQGSLVRTDGPLQAYLDGLSPHFVRNVARVSRKLAKLPGNEVVFLSGCAADPALLGQFTRLEAAGWKGSAGGAIDNDARVRAFYATLVERLYASGWLEWHLVRAEGQLLAAHLACRIGRCLVLWKIAFNEQYGAYAPGNILMMRTLERAFADHGVDEVNCVTETPWNRNWNMSRRSYHDLVLWPRRPWSVAAGYLPHHTRRLLRHVPAAKALYRRLCDARRRLLAAVGERPRAPEGVTMATQPAAPSECQLRSLPLAGEPPTMSDRARGLRLRLWSALRRRVEKLGPFGRWLLPEDPPPVVLKSVPAVPPPAPAASSEPGRPGPFEEGDLVRVLPVERLRATLDESQRTEGLTFFSGMERYCGKAVRVRKRVRTIFDERAQRMLRLKNTYVLEGSICDGRDMFDKEGCDRGCFYFWKDRWLESVNMEST